MSRAVLGSSQSIDEKEQNQDSENAVDGRAAWISVEDIRIDREEIKTCKIW